MKYKKGPRLFFARYSVDKINGCHKVMCHGFDYRKMLNIPPQVPVALLPSTSTVTQVKIPDQDDSDMESINSQYVIVETENSGAELQEKDKETSVDQTPAEFSSITKDMKEGKKN